MNTLTITYYTYQHTQHISKKLKQKIYDYAHSLSLTVTGNISHAHITLYDHIIQALQQNYNVHLIPQKKDFYYIFGDPFSHHWKVTPTKKTNLIPTFTTTCGHTNIWQGKLLEHLLDSPQLLKPELKYDFDCACPRKGDIIIYNEKRYTCIPFGILTYFEHLTHIHTLIEKHLLPNGTQSTTEEIENAIFNTPHNHPIIHNKSLNTKPTYETKQNKKQNKK